MIGGFVRAQLAALTEADLDALEALMETARPPIWPTG